VAPPEQSTLAFAPTVIVHIDVPVHFRLQESPHVPEQSFMFEQSSEQLLPHVVSETEHACPDGQVHVDPLHLTELALLPPQPSTSIRASEASLMLPIVAEPFARCRCTVAAQPARVV
jgi:hypothetical protein